MLPYSKTRINTDDWVDSDGTVHRFDTNGHTPGPVSVTDPDDEENPVRHLRPTLASGVVMRRIRWLWEHRIPLGGLTLLAGREGLGKSSIAVDLTAQITRGEMHGELHGTPSNVIYINSEDARDYTIVPRLVAAGADLDRVIFLDAITSDDIETTIVLPLDTDLLAAAVTEHQAVMVVLDAATSVIDSRLDGDKDRQVRQGLEAIARKVGERTGCAVLGIVHFGKRDSNDTGKLILGSIAWSQVARSTLAVALDTDTGNLTLTGSKANLTATDVPSLICKIVSHQVDTIEGPTSVGRVTWLGETDQDARDLLDSGEAAAGRAERNEARDWLEDWLSAGQVKSSDAKRAATAAGISERTLQRARASLRVRVTAEGYPRVTYWSLPARVDSGASPATPRAREQGGTTGSTTTDLHKHDGTTVAQPWHNPGTTEPDSRANGASHATQKPTSGATGATAGLAVMPVDTAVPRSPARTRPPTRDSSPIAPGDQWVHAHLTTRPQTIAQLATALDATGTTIETVLARLEYAGHAQCHTQPGKPDGWSLPTKGKG